MTQDGVEELVTLLRQERLQEKLRLQASVLQDAIKPIEINILRAQESALAEIRYLEHKLTDAQAMAGHTADLETEHEHLTREFNRLSRIQKKRSTIIKKGLRDRVELDLIKDQIETLIVAKSDLKSKVENIQSEIEELRVEYVKAQEELKNLPAIQKRLVANEFWLSQARKAAQETAVLKDEIDRMKYKVEQNTFVKTEALALKKLRDDIEKLGYDPSLHEKLKTQIYKLI